MERTLQVLDCAVLVISGTGGVQGYTQTLWKLLARHEKIPSDRVVFPASTWARIPITSFFIQSPPFAFLYV